MLIFDAEGTILWMNPAAEKSLGFGPLGLIGTDIVTLVHPQDLDAVLATLERIRKYPGLVLAGDFRIHNAQGQWLNTECSMTNLLQDPAVNGVVATFQDVTRHMLAETARRDAESKFRQIFENAIEGIFQSAPDGGFLSVNPSLARILGYDTPDELITQIHDIGREIYVDRQRRELFLRLMEMSSTLTGFESQVRRKDGSTIWVCENARCVRSLQGRILYFEGTVEDVTKRRDTEEALRVSEERYALAASGMNGGLWDWDLRTGKVFYSPRWKELTGDPRNIGDTPEEWFIRLFPRDREIVDREIQQCLQGETKRFEVEFRLRQKDGSFRWMQASGMSQSPDADHPPERIAGSMIDITSRKEAEEQIQQGALYDALTGLPNRALFMDRLHRALRRRGTSIAAVLFLDLDRFKLVNESYGHNVGDEVLKQVGVLLERAAGIRDTVARFSGDEFGILLDGLSDIADAIRMAIQARKVLEEPLQINGTLHKFSASIGIAFSKVGNESAEELLRDAETAMYRAKAMGKAQHVLFDQGMHEYTLKRLHLENDLRKAIETGQFLMVYQPIVSLYDNKLRGFESLIRWMHPERGLVSPTAFIPLAEETGLICEIGRWVLEESCRQVAHWKRTFPEMASDLHVSVNLSGRQFAQDDLSDQVLHALEASGLSPHDLKLEITESLLMDNADSAASVLSRFREMGIRISIDDFGTGYSSLSYLHKFPAQTLKIDRSFVGNLETETSQLAIVRAVVSLAHVMGMDVVAEGIETTSHLGLLKQLGCEYGQGYLFAKPMLAGAVEAMFATRNIYWH